MEEHNKGMKGLYTLLIVLVLIASGMGVYLFRDKIFTKSNEERNNNEVYNLYINYLNKHSNSEVYNEKGKLVKVDTVYVRMIKVDGIEKPLMMVDGYDQDDARLFNMYYVDEDGNVKVEYFDDDTYYNAVYNYNNKDYKYYLLKRTNGDIDYYDHIISLADYINDKTKKEEYDVIGTDPMYIGFELDDKVEIKDNVRDSLKQAIKNMKSLDEFYRNEKEIIDDAHREYKAYHEDD